MPTMNHTIFKFREVVVTDLCLMREYYKVSNTCVKFPYVFQEKVSLLSSLHKSIKKINKTINLTKLDIQIPVFSIIF